MLPVSWNSLMWCKCLWLFWLTALSSVMYDMLASPNKRGTFWLIISGFILFRFFYCKERVLWDGERQWGRKKERKALFCEQKNRFRIIKAADSYSISVQYIYQVSPRRIRNLSLGIYLIHYELIRDKHLQSDRDLYFYLRELISSTGQNYPHHQAYWTCERKLMLIRNLYAGRCGRFVSIF